jgi:biotin carboxylase
LKRTLLMVSGGIEAVPGIRLAKEMGLHVVVSDGNPQAPGMAVADDHLVVSTYDVHETVAAACRYHATVRPIDGVMCIASDVPLTVAHVAAALGLPGISTRSARLASDKMAMKHRFALDHIPIPYFSEITSASDLRSIIRTRGFPLVLKPVDSRGARGVLRLTVDVDPAWAVEFSRSFSPSCRIMVEEYLDGPQVSTESLVIDGVAYTPGFSDRNYELLERYHPHIIENGGELPSHLPVPIQQSVREVVGRAAASMGIQNGVVKGDIVVSRGKPYVIELAARLSGGYFCTHEIPLNTGVNFVGLAIRQSLGEKPRPEELLPTIERGVAQRYLFPSPGRVTRISRVEEVRRRADVSLCEVRVGVGDMVGPIRCHPHRAGVVIAVGNSRDDAVARVLDAISQIEIEMEQSSGRAVRPAA